MKKQKIYPVAKRIVDLLIAGTLLIVLMPAMVIAGLSVYFILGSPIFFKQPRPGLDGKIFDIIKFRTMTNAVDSSGKLLSDEIRLLPAGAWLRRWSLDELPQLWNVIRGEMSLVGPRPLLVEYMPLYNARQSLRHRVKPGVTGWAQVNGRNALGWQERLELDALYAERPSFFWDIKILLLTLKKVLYREGIEPVEGVMMHKFKGNGRQFTQDKTKDFA